MLLIRVAAHAAPRRALPVQKQRQQRLMVAPVPLAAAADTLLFPLLNPCAPLPFSLAKQPKLTDYVAVMVQSAAAAAAAAASSAYSSAAAADGAQQVWTAAGLPGGRAQGGAAKNTAPSALELHKTRDATRLVL